MAVRNEILKKHFDKLGFDKSFFDAYESKTADRLQNFDKMCDTLYDIYRNQTPMTIYTDFDVDGIMSVVISYAGFSELGFKVNLFKPIPARGYGFRPEDVDDILNEFPDTTVIFTGDVGIACNEAIDYAHSKNISVLVTDHHIGQEPCRADIAVNPNQMGETYSHHGICGSYVIYMILEEYAKRYCSPSAQADIYRLQAFAGIATVSDVMPLLYENRQLVRNSVSIVRYFYNYELVDGSIAPPVYSDNYSRAFIGLKKLLEYFCEKRKIKTQNDITEQFYSFYLVPFLNSCKRMNGNMSGIYDIFFSAYISPLPGFDRMSCVENGISYIEVLSERRKLLTEEYFDKLLDEKKAGTSIYSDCEVYITDVLPGLCGLLATKLMALTGLPTMVLVRNDDGSFSGSGRCPSWIDIAGLVNERGLARCDGHKEAFGISFPNIQALDDYRLLFKSVVLAELEAAEVVDTSVIISNSRMVPCDFSADSELIKDYLIEKPRYGPFGKGFPEPRFKFIIDPDTVRVMLFGQTKQHAKLVTGNGIEILLFFLALDYEKLCYDYRGKKYVFVCSGIFCFDTYNDAEFDTLNFLCDDIDVMEM